MADLIKNSFSDKVLPSYGNPPVDEVVCGVRFESPGNLLIPHIGLLWDKFRSDYPNLRHAPPIAFAKGEIIVDPMTGVPLPRVWFINKSDDQLIQFQVDRVYFNWRRRQGEYPRYEHVISEFGNVLETLKIFFSEFKLGEFKVIEYEISYINHIPTCHELKKTDDLSRIFTDFHWEQPDNRFLTKPEKVSWQTEFILPEGKGVLNVGLREAIRTEDKVPVFVLELKAKGTASSIKSEDIREWFNLAREWIVRGFTDLTTPEMHELWEIE